MRVQLRQFLFPLLLVYLCASDAQSFPSTIKAIKPSIVGVGTVEKTRSPSAIPHGTGFVVADGRYVVTNAHVLPKKLNHQRKEYLAIFVITAPDAYISRKAYIVARDDEYDVSLLRIDGKPLPALDIDFNKQVTEGEQYLFTGFPIANALGLTPVTHRAMVSAVTLVVMTVANSRQLSAHQIKSLRDPYPIFQLDAIAYPGSSGSPLYDPKTGEVIGVVNMGRAKSTKESLLTDPSGISYAIPVFYVRKLFKKAKLPID